MMVDCIEYEFWRGSDIRRDGMYLEAMVKDTDPLKEVAEVFYSDRTSAFTVSCFEPDVPLELLEELIRRARQELPSVQR